MPKLKGRQPGFEMGAEHRTKIANSKILNRLIGHVEGSVDMTPSQVTAGLGLLKKVMPDMTENMVKGTGANGAIELISKIERVLVKAPDQDA